MKNAIKMALVIGIILIITTGCGNKDLNKTKQITFKDLKVDIPTVFEKNDEFSDADLFQFGYDTDDNKNVCMMTLAKMEGYPSSDLKETVYEGLLRYNNIEYSTKTINGTTWTTGYYKASEKQINHYYATNYNNTLYEFSYDDFGSGDLCDKAFEKISNSLSFR